MNSPIKIGFSLTNLPPGKYGLVIMDVTGSKTPYFYSTYDEENEAPPLPGQKVLVIGSGPIRIGQGIEFDYSAVHAAWALWLFRPSTHSMI